MSAGNALKALPMIIVDTSTLNNLTYTEVTPSGGITHNIARLYVLSNCTRDIIVSYDGVTAHDVWNKLIPLEFIPQLSATPTNYVSVLSRGTRFFLKTSDALPGGQLYVVMYYQN